MKNTKKKEAIDKPVKFSCEFCSRSFLRESTVLNHICEYKHRWLEKDRAGNRIGFQTWLHFYLKNSPSVKVRTYEEFIKSPYYTAFVKFGNYCVAINALNVTRLVDWLLKNQIKLDTWTTDKVYTKYLIEYLREEDPYDAITRSIETTIKLAKEDNIQSHDCLRYSSKNKICYEITTGRISPWLLYNSNSGLKFLGELDPTQVQMINDYINPELWAIKFLREKETIAEIKGLLATGGY